MSDFKFVALAVGSCSGLMPNTGIVENCIDTVQGYTKAVGNFGTNLVEKINTTNYYESNWITDLFDTDGRGGHIIYRLAGLSGIAALAFSFAYEGKTFVRQ